MESRSSVPDRPSPVSQPVRRQSVPFEDRRASTVEQRRLQDAAHSRSTHYRSKEDEFRAVPAEFLKRNVLSLTMEQGMKNRYASNEVLNKAYSDFLKKLGSFNKHWFKLVPDTNRSKPGHNAYILTPAIEKYLQAFPEDALLSPLREVIEKELPIGADANYITSAYVDYKTVFVTADAADSVGHATITKSREHEADFNPDFVFTAAMNGCAFAVTPSETEDHFTAWHFQSTRAHLNQASTFRQTQNPFDWYGTEEYDDEHHEGGSFEVTNFLHRGADNQWSVISQQNETSAARVEDVYIKNVHRRILNMSGQLSIESLKRIHGGIQANKSDEIQGLLARVAVHKARLSPEMQTTLQTLIAKITRKLNSEKQQLAATTSLAGLNAVGTEILASRAVILADINSKKKAVWDYMDKAEKKENTKWKFRRDQQLIVGFTSSMVNLENAVDKFSNTSWVGKLIEETRPRP